MPLERAPGVLREVLERLLAGESLSEVDAQQLLVQLTDEALSPAMVGALLVALVLRSVWGIWQAIQGRGLEAQGLTT